MRWSPDIQRIPWLTARPIAHRGLHDRSAGVVENTSSAFAAAMNGNYAIECDLQLTADGEAVVFHDDILDRLTTASGLVSNHQCRELQKVPIKDSADCMQTLAEMLEQVAGRVPLVIELKSRWTGDTRLALRALDILENYAGPYALMSFDPDMIECVCTHSPQTVRGIVADRSTDPFYLHFPLARRLELRTLSHGFRTQPDFLSFRWQDLPFETVGRFRAHGLPVISWTIRSAGQVPKALRYSDQITFEGFKA